VRSTLFAAAHEYIHTHPDPPTTPHHAHTRIRTHTSASRTRTRINERTREHNASRNLESNTCGRWVDNARRHFLRSRILFVKRVGLGSEGGEPGGIFRVSCEKDPLKGEIELGLESAQEMQKRREGGREGGREGERERGREGERERGREGERERGREGEREGGRDGSDQRRSRQSRPSANEAFARAYSKSRPI